MIDRTTRQEEGIQKWINAKCRGSLQWATGTGILIKIKVIYKKFK